MSTENGIKKGFEKAQMVYDDYLWTAEADAGNDYYIRGAGDTELNRMEGAEVLSFINHFLRTNFLNPMNLEAFQETEVLIRTKVPSDITTHKNIARWIFNNWAKYHHEVLGTDIHN